MSSRLDLPPERDLPVSSRRAIRTELVRATRPSRRRPLAVRLVVVLGLVAVLALGLGLTRPWVRTAPVAGVPSVAPVPATTTSPSASVEISPQPIDEGPVTAARLRTLVNRCLADADPTTSVQDVLFARRTSIDGDVVLVTDEDGHPHTCLDGSTERSSRYSSRTAPLPAADAEHPVVRLFPPAFTSTTGAARDTTSAGTTYAVGPEVASLQLRLTVDGRTGPWFEASRSGGFAWAAAEVDHVDPRADGTTPAPVVEDRAFAADGRELTIDRQPG